MTTRDSRTDLIAAVAAVFVGVFFLFQAMRIDAPNYQTAAEALVGPAIVPKIVAFLIIGLGSLEALSVLVFRKDNRPEAEGDAEPSEFHALTPAVLGRLVATVVIGFAYLWLLSATGYASSTAITLAVLLLLFGNRPGITLAIIAIVGAAIYYYLFIKLMGIYSPIGWLINIG